MATDEDTPVNLTLPATDSDGNALTFAVVDAPAHGTLTTGTGAARTYTPAANFTGEDQFTFTASDGRATTAKKTVKITVKAVNDAPAVTLGATTSTFTEGGAAVRVDPDVTVVDVDDDRLSGATVAIGAGFETGADVLAFSPQAGITGSYDAASGVLTLSGDATIADYQTVLRSVTFDNPGSALSSTTRQIVFRATDGEVFGASPDRAVTVSVIDDPPVLSGGGNAATYEEDSATGELVAPAVAIADVDSPNLEGATVAITTGLVAVEDRLTFTAQPGITGTFDTTTGVLSFTGAASLADYQAILRSVRYRNANTANPSSATRTVLVQVDDGPELSNTVTGTVAVTAINDAPTVNASGASPAFTEGGAAVVVDPSLTVGDVDSSALVSASLSITTGHEPTEDVLALPATPGLTSSFNAATGVLTITGSATPAAYETALRTVTYANTNADNPSSTTRTVRFVVDDGETDHHASTAADAPVQVAPVNDAPVLSNGGNTVTFTEDDATGVLVNAGLGVADVDSATLASAAVQITTAFNSAEDRLVFTDQNGITGTFDTTTGVLALSGTASVADYRTALRSIRYRNLNGDAPSTTQRVVTFTVNDGAASSNASNSVLSSVDINPLNDAPSLTAGGGSPTFTEGGTGVVVDPAIAVSDVDSTSLASATVQITGGLDVADDRLLFTNTATITGNYTAATGTLVLTGADTLAAYQAALRTVQYRNLDTDNPSTTSRTVSFTVSDSSLVSNAVATTVGITAVNDGPTMTASGGTASFVEDGGAVAVDPALSVSDVDDATFTGATIKVTAGFVAGQDSLTFSDTATITGSWDPATQTLTLSGTDTVANYQAALRAVKFANSSQAPTTGARTVSFSLADSGSLAASDTRDVTVTPANDAPTVVAGGGSPSWTEGGPAVVVDSGIQVSDIDGDQITGATVGITSGWTSSDRLNFTNQLGITGSFNTGTGVLTLTGTTSAANYQTALRTITFSNVSGQPATAVRSISFAASDGAATSATATTSLTVISTNSAPTLGAGGNTLAYTEDDPATAINPAITVADSDDTDLESATVQLTAGYDNGEDQLTFSNTASITGSWSSVTGVLTLTGTDTKANYEAALRAVKYVNNDHAAPSTASRTASFVVNDGEANSTAVTSTITVASANDAPTLTAGTANTQTFTEGGSAVAVDNAIAVADVDTANLAGATVSITTGFSSTQGDTLTFVNQNGITGSYTAGTGVLTLTGSATVANYQAALRSITFSNTSDAPTTSRTVSFTATDGTATSAAVTHAVTIQPVNDAPLLTGGGTLAYTENDPATDISPALSVTDADNANLTGATVSISAGLQAAQDVLQFANTASITGIYNFGTGVLTLTGTDTVANYQAALRSVKYRNISDSPNTAARTITYAASDGALSGTTTATVNVTAVNDAPVAANTSHTGASAAIGNTSLVVDDPTDGAIDPAGLQKTVTGDILSGATDPDSSTLSVVPGTVATVDGGSVTFQADGDYVYTPKAATSCTDHSDSVTYSVTDNESTPATGTGTISFDVADCVWYVDNQSAAGGNGTSSTPFDTLDEADDAATGTGDFLYVVKGDGSTTGLNDGDGVSLLASQHLVGAAEPLVVGGTTLATGNNANRPSLVTNVTLGSSNVVEGLQISTGLGWAISGGAGDNSGTLDNLTVNGTGSGGGVELLATSGTWNVSDLSVSTPGNAFEISSAGTVNLASAGTISLSSSSGRGFTASSSTLSGTLDSVTASASPTTGISLTDTAGSLTIDDVNVTSTGTGLFLGNTNGVTVNNSGDASISSSGTAVDLNTDTAVAVTTQPSVTLSSVTSTGGARGIRINDIGAGTFSATAGTLSGQTTAAVDISAGSGNVSYGGTIGNGSGLSASVANRAGGTVTLSGNINDSNDAGGGLSITGSTAANTTRFTGATKTLNTGASNAVTYAAAGSDALELSGGGLDIDTTTGRGIFATGASGTISVAGSSNSITSGSGTALEINAPDIAAADVTFQSIASNGAASGIVLANTGTAGGLHVTGSGGVAGSGGTITASSGAGVDLTSTSEVQLASVAVTNGATDGIRGVGVSGFSLTGSAAVTGNGNAVGEHGIDMTELSGTAGNPVTLTGATVTGNAENNLSIVNDAATISSLSITGGSYGSNSTTIGNDGIHIENTGTGDTTGATISGVTLTNNRGDHIQVITDNSNSSDQTVSITGNTLRGTGNQPGNTMVGGGIALGAGGNAVQKIIVNNNDIERAYGAPISLNTSSGTSPTVGWTVNNNTIGTSGEVNSGSESNVGIYGNVNGDGTVNALIQSNTIYRTDFSHIDIVQNDGDADLSLTMKGNVLLEGGDPLGDYIYGVRLTFGSASTDNGTNCLDMGATSPNSDKNAFSTIIADPSGYDLRMRMAGGAAALKLVGYVGGATDDSAVATYLVGRNDFGGTPTVFANRFDASSTYTGAVTCPKPADLP